MYNRHHICLIASALSLACSPPAQADEPLAPPAKVVTCSKSGAICAESDPKTGRTDLRRNGDSAVLWSIKGWHRWMFVANDGDSLVVGYDGMSLVPRSASLQLEVLQFYDRSRMVRSVRLGDLYNDLSQLRTTMSHLAWVRSIAINGTNQLDLELVDGRHKQFALK